MAALSHWGRGLLLTVVALAALLCGAAAWAVAADVVDNYDITSGSADRTVVEFVRQSTESKLSVVLPANALSQFKTNAVHGRFRAGDALNALLRDSGLEASISGEGVVIISITKGADGTMSDNRARAGWIGGLIALLSAHLAMQPALAKDGEALSRPDARPDTEESLQEVLVTGSRVANGNDAPTPVTVVSTEQLLDVQPGTIVRALQNLPVFAGSQGQTTTPGGGQNTGSNGSAGGVNIRNLNPYRTLVLYDGLRVPPVSNSGFVSIDMIPQMLLQRVDVVTGGASAVYGSDAVSGVVNFITDRKFNGVKFKAQGGISHVHDDRIVDFGVAGGTSLFGGRGHLEGSLEYIYDPGIWTQTTRDFGRKRLRARAFGSGLYGSAGHCRQPIQAVHERPSGHQQLRRPDQQWPPERPALRQQRRPFDLHEWGADGEHKLPDRW